MEHEVFSNSNVEEIAEGIKRLGKAIEKLQAN